jgi:hypothetical protein
MLLDAIRIVAQEEYVSRRGSALSALLVEARKYILEEEARVVFG